MIVKASPWLSTENCGLTAAVISPAETTSSPWHSWTFSLPVLVIAPVIPQLLTAFAIFKIPSLIGLGKTRSIKFSSKERSFRTFSSVGVNLYTRPGTSGLLFCSQFTFSSLLVKILFFLQRLTV